MKKFSVLLNLFFFGFSVLGFSHGADGDLSENESKVSHHHELQFGSFYTKEHVVVAPEHAIPFDSESVFHTKGIDHHPGSGEFILKESGVYRVTYSVSVKEEKCGSYLREKEEHARRVALTLNGHVILGSEMFIGEHDHLSTMSLLIKVCGKSCCDHVLRVINNNSLADGWHNLHLRAGRCRDDVTAAIVIERVAGCPWGCCCSSQ